MNNWVISGYDMIGNLTIRNGGTVSVSNGALIFSQNLGTDGIPDTADDHIYTLIIEDGGKLILNNASLTTNLNQVHAYPSLAVIVRNGGVLEVHDSVLKFPGYLIVDDASLILDNSVVTGFTPTEIATYCDSKYFPVENSTSAFDDSPIMLLMSANVVMSDSRIERVFEPANGVSSTTYSHEYPFVSGAVGGAVTNYVLNRMPASVSGGVGALSDLTMDDLKQYRLNKGQTLNINGIDTAGLVFSSTDGVTITLNVKYNTTAGYNGGGQYVKWNFLNSASKNTGIMPTDTTTTYDVNRQVTESYVLPSMSSADLSKLHISYQNSDSGSASIFFNEIWVSLTMPLSTYRNVTLAGSTQMTAINTYVGVDFSNDTLLHNVLAVCDNSNAYMYGVSVDMSQDPTPLSLREAAFVAVEKKIDATAQGSGPVEAANDGFGYTVAPSSTMSLNGFNISGVSGNIESATLKVIYNTAPGYSQNNYVEWSSDGSTYKTSSIRPSVSVPNVTASYVLPNDQIGTLDDVNTLRVRFTNNAGGANVYFDKVWVEVTLKPTIYIYRWVELNVTDTQSLPVSGANVDVVLQNSPEQQPVYYPSGSTIYYPPANVLNYLGRNEGNFNITGEDGFAYVPLLSQVLDQTNPYPNESISYFLTVTYENATGSIFQNSSAVSFVRYPQMDAQNQTVTIDMTLSDLILDKPDLYVESITTIPARAYENDTMAVEVVIGNHGLTAANNVLVNVTGYASGVNQMLGSMVISTVPAGGSVTLMPYPTWVQIPAGVVTVTVDVDPNDAIVEPNKLNNKDSVQVTVLPNIPELSITDVDLNFEPQPAYTGSSLYANVTVHNTEGRADAVNVNVSFFAGNPNSGGMYIGTSYIDVSEGGTSVAFLQWNPPQIGIYPIYVVVNGDRSIAEYSYDNNSASKVIEVKLSTGGYDLVIDGTPAHPNLVMMGETIPFDGNIVVNGSGVLTLDDAALMVLQPSASKPKYIVVEDMGQIVLLRGSNIYSNATVTIFMSGDSVLSLTGSSLDLSVIIHADNNTMVDIDGSTVAADLITMPTSSTVVTASNTTFMRAWSSFGGSAIAYLMNVSIPSLSPKEDAVVYHYRWIEVSVLDGTGQALPGSTVELQLLIGTPYASGICDANGVVLFKALCDIVDSSGTQFVGNYRVNATFWFSGEPYYNATGWMDVSLQPYMPPAVLSSTVKMVDIVIDEGLAEILVQMNGISITPAVPSVASQASIDVTVWNLGDTDAINVIVTFNYTSAGTGTGTIGTDTIAIIPAKSFGQANIAWIPIAAGDYTITVWAEGAPIVQETNKINNQASVPVHVNDLPDLQFTDLSIYPGNTVEVGNTVRVEATVLNNGETAASSILVRFYLGDPATGLNFDNKSITALVPGQSYSVTSSAWIAAINDGTPSQAYQISVAINPEWTIQEIRYDNNNGSKTLTVNDARPDLSFITGSLNIKNGTQQITEAEIGKSVNITVQVRNSGATNAVSSQIFFYAVNASDPLKYVEIGNLTQSAISAMTTVSLYKVWVVNVSMGAWSITVFADPHDLIDEMSDANNIIIKNVTVTAPTPYITVSFDKTQYKGGETITVYGEVRASVRGIVLPGVPVNVSIYQNGLLVKYRETMTSASGAYSVGIMIPEEMTGSIDVRVSAGYSGHVAQESRPITVSTFNEATFLPWWIYAVIILLVAAIIIFFSMYLYRYSLSRMVECGECGALIPESSKKCPKCGTEFEVGTVKCSECGAWIPADSKICPECQAKFVGEALPEQEDPYIQSMRQQYDSFVDGYREEAKTALGKKYSDAKFADWWKKQAAYISFEDWLSQEEMKRKASAFPCPVCGTPNAKGSTECHKCGTVFEAPKPEQKKEADEEKPKVRRMIKRPAQKPPAEKPAEPAPSEEKQEKESP